MREPPAILFGFRVFLFLAVTFLGWSNSSVAETEQPFCQADARFGPDGRIVELGERYFRVCGPKSEGFPYRVESTKERPFIKIGPKSLIAHQVEAATNAPKYLWGFISFETGFIDMGLKNLKRSTVIAQGSLTLGNAQYSVYASPDIVEEVQGTIEKGNLPRFALFVFDRPAGSVIPSHYMSCDGDPTAMPRSKYHCRIYLKYRESDDLGIRHVLLWSPVFEGEPMDFEHLPELVSALHALFEASDVTGQLDEFEGVPIVRASDSSD